MIVRISTRLLISGLVTILVVLSLISFIVVERRDLNAQTAKLIDLQKAVSQVRELSLYVQYSAHDTNAYALGHLEHREEFVKHTQVLARIALDLQQIVDQGLLDQDAQVQFDRIKRTRKQYERSAQQLFIAIEANRDTPSTKNRAQEDEAWETSSQLSDQLDRDSQELASQINELVQDIQVRLASRNQWMLSLVFGLGVIIVVLLILIQGFVIRAVGKPLRALLIAVQQFAAGNVNVRFTITRLDEVGELGRAFNEMAATIQWQTQDLQAQFETAKKARSEAETAQAEIASQLATIEQQRNVIREMSVPILPISLTIMVMPLVGALDSARLNLVQEQALRAIEQTHAHHLIIDITGVPIVDTQVAQGLIQVVRAVRLLGAESILVGLRPEVAQAIVGLGIHLDSLVTRSTLYSGIAYAVAQR